MRDTRCFLMRLFTTAVFLASMSVTLTWAETVKIGLNMPLTGVQAGVGKEVESVWRAFVKHANKNQLVKGHTLELVVLDDGFDPVKTKSNTEKMIQQGVAVFTATPGVPTVQAMVPLLESSRTPLVAPASGSPALRGKSSALFHVKASFAAEVDQMAAQLAGMGARRIAVLTDDVNDRKGLVDRFRAELQKVSNGASVVTEWVVLPQQGGSTRAAIEKVMASKPDTVYVMTIAGLTGEALKELSTKGFRGNRAAWSVAANEQVRRILGSDGPGTIFGAVVPSPTADNTRLNINFSQFAREAGAEPTFRSMETYITARLIVKALTQVNGDVTGPKVWAALERMGDSEIDDWRLRFSPTNREGSSYATVTMLRKNGKFF
jgi:branched-chain amino acid transport system substrate-binding protein